MSDPIDPKEPIAIIGMGGLFPGAKDVPSYWSNILSGKDSIIEIPKERWDWRLYYDPDPSAPDKTYSKIGGFVRDFSFDPVALRIPAPVARQMDTVQQLAVAAASEALRDSGYDKKPFDSERAAVIFGNSMGGPKKEASDLRVYRAAVRESLETSATFKGLGAPTRSALLKELDSGMTAGLLSITEDTMPGELSNVIAGRIANLFNFNGPNFTVDAACAASLAGLAQAVNGLRLRQFDLAVAGGADQMMAPPAYVKFCKIGALSPDGSRPFDALANGFVMGEGAGALVLKRLSDARRDGDGIHALIRAVGASSDGKGKGITAPNPKGQRLAIERAFAALDYGPGSVGLLEAHGTSTKVGDVVEVQTAAEFFKAAGRGALGLGSVKSQIGHLKAAAGVAGLIKAALALRHKVLPPTIHFKTPNPGVDWSASPFRVLTRADAWDAKGPRRAHVSAFGFGGTNFHVALEDVSPETLSWTPAPALALPLPARAPSSVASGLEGEAFLLGAETEDALRASLGELEGRAARGESLASLALEFNARARGALRLAIAAESGPKLAEKARAAAAALSPSLWKKAPPLFKAKSIHPGVKRGRPKIAFLFPGQGSQYVDMLKDLSEKYRVVEETFREADAVLEPLLGSPLTKLLWTRAGESPERLAAMQERIKRTEITQPAVLTADVALLRLVRGYGVEADVVCGHSLGEYAALVAAGTLRFSDALLAVSSRAKEMAAVRVSDPGKMASIAASVEKVEPVLAGVAGYVIAANKNCPIQTVIAGATPAVEEAVRRFASRGVQAQLIEVSHAFHSEIVAPAQEAYGRFLDRIPVSKPEIPVLSNVHADYYPEEPAAIRRLMVEQIAKPVEFIRQIRRMHEDGVRLFVEIGPKRALSAFVANTLEGPDVHVVSSNHPKKGGIHEFNDLLARLHACGVDLDLAADDPGHPRTRRVTVSRPEEGPGPLGEVGLSDSWGFYTGPVLISGVAAGTPGNWERVFRESALDELLQGRNFIGRLSETDLERQLDKNILRLIKAQDGNHRIECIRSAAEVVHLAALAGEFDLAKEFGFKDAVARAMDVSSRLAVAAGLLALRDAGIPLVRTWRRTTTGGRIPSGWALPEPLREETGVLFASSFPGLDSMASEVARHLAERYRGKPLRELEALFDSLLARVQDPEQRGELKRWHAASFKEYLDRGERGAEGPYEFSRDFLLRVMPLGHSQLAQWISARGPAAHVSAACASTTQAVAMAEDWLRLGRAKRVIVVAGDDVTSPTLREWVLSGFLAAGAATTETVLSEAALPFDRRRNGMILGMGAAGLVLERGEALSERGMRGLAELLAGQYENSAYHAVRLHPEHASRVLGRLLEKAERRFGLKRSEIAAKALFMSHETYTPARGGSASAEVRALKAAFGGDASKILVANLKGYTGHSMGASMEDPVAVRALVTGRVPPIANYREPDPELAGVRLSEGGVHDLEYAIRLGAGFGSQLAMTLMRRVLRAGESRVADPARHKSWLMAVSGEAEPRLEVEGNTLRVSSVSSPPSSASVLQASPSRPAPDEPSVREAVLALVGEKTGYPREMLELDLDMEADLGIDTVKQAELFGLIREKYSIPRQESLALKDYPTLRHVIGFVLSAAPPSGGAASAVSSVFPLSSPPSVPPPPPFSSVRVPPAPSPSSPSGALDEPSVREAVLALVGEKTGYPREMLELDLDMEADLGIDTVKQAELFGLIREKYSIPRQESLALKDYPTLKHVIGFVLSAAPPSGGAASAVSPVSPFPPPSSSLRVASVPSSSPSPMPPARRWTLRLSERAAPSLPVTFDPERPVLVRSMKPESAEPFLEAVRKRGGTALFLRASAWKSLEEAEGAVRKALKGRAASGLLDLTCVEAPGFQTLTASGFEKAYAQGPRALFLAAKVLAKDFSEAGSWLLVLTRSGGRHHLGSQAPNPLAGLHGGLAKALGKELGGARVQTLDFDDRNPAEMARSVLEELGRADAPSEAGFEGSRRLVFTASPQALSGPERKLNSRSVVLVSGGAQGLGAACAKELARRFQCQLILLGRTPLPAEAASWARMSETELKDMKMRLWEELKQDGSRKATPALLEREFSPIAKAAEAQRAIEAMCRAGSRVQYLGVDLSDSAAVAKAVKAVLRSHGDIDVVLHAAGLESSRLLEDKTLPEFDAVARAKAHGAFHLLKALAPSKKRAWIFFSSIVGRFGNLGQTDYAAANDFLAKLAAHLSRREERAVAVDLTAISIGMTTRGGVESFLKSQGVEFLPPEEAANLILEELLRGGSEPEVLLAGKLGKLDREGLLRPAPNGASASPAARQAEPKPLERRFSLEADPWLKDHAIGGVPYLPGVMGLELFAQAAGPLGGAPRAFSDVRFALPVKLLRGKPVSVRVHARADERGRALALESDFIGPGGVKLGGPRLHFSARLAEDAPAPRPPELELPKGDARAASAEDVYAAYFHGPSFHVLSGVRELSERRVLASWNPDVLKRWEKPFLWQPLLVEAAFQACGFRDLRFLGRMTLPDSIASVRVFSHGALPEELHVLGIFLGHQDGKSAYDAYVYDSELRLWAELREYRMIAS